MTTYNTKKSYLFQSINSIIKQSFKKFEFIIINDGSNYKYTTELSEIIEQINDNRIKLISNKNNCGITKCLNQAIKISVGKYIARMDADDIALPNRIQKQFDFLESNPDIGVLGTFAKILSGKIISRNIILPISHEEIKASLLINSPIIHPSVMIRSNILKKNLYDETFIKGQDYELWSRLINKTKFHNLPCILMKYRVHEDQATQKHSELQIESSTKIKALLYSELGLNLDLIIASKYLYSNNLADNQLYTLKLFFENIIESNNKKNIYNSTILIKVLSRNFDKVITKQLKNNSNYGLTNLRRLRLEPNHTFTFDTFKMFLFYLYKTLKEGVR